MGLRVEGRLVRLGGTIQEELWEAGRVGSFVGQGTDGCGVSVLRATERFWRMTVEAEEFTQFPSLGQSQASHCLSWRPAVPAFAPGT